MAEKRRKASLCARGLALGDIRALHPLSKSDRVLSTKLPDLRSLWPRVTTIEGSEKSRSSDRLALSSLTSLPASDSRQGFLGAALGPAGSSARVSTFATTRFGLFGEP